MTLFSCDQTKRILQVQRNRYSLEGRLQQSSSEHIYKLHHNAQRLIKERVLEGVRCVLPFASHLIFPDDRVLMRRDHEKYLSLIISIATLFQFQREAKTAKTDDGREFKYTLVTLEDVALANKFAAEILGRSLDELAPPSRELLNLIKKMVDDTALKTGKKKQDILFTRRELKDYTGWSYWQIHDHLIQLVKMEYIQMTKGGKDNRCRYELLWDGKGEDGSKFFMGLIDVEGLRKKLKGKNIN